MCYNDYLFIVRKFAYLVFCVVKNKPDFVEKSGLNQAKTKFSACEQMLF